METVLLPILLFAGVAALVAIGMLVLGQAFGPKRSSAVKEMPYESGMDPIHDTRRRFDVRFHLVAICFLIFDVELLFLYPWAVASKDESGVTASLVASMEPAGVENDPAAAVTNEQVRHGRLLILIEVLVFIGLLALGFVYAWRKGVFQWR